MWVFGYGSLTWKADFAYSQRVVGYIKGYHRRFWQASVDHRGTHDKPGRVATLVPADDPEARVWGVAYYVTDNIGETTASLDVRERRFDCRALLPMFEPGGKELPDRVLVYVGSSTPSLFLGPAPLCEMAQQIVSCQGPSGTNREYLLRLASFMREEAPHADDPHLFQLEEAVTRLLEPHTDTNTKIHINTGTHT